MYKQILITGGTGLLGKALIETCDRNICEIMATFLGDYWIEDSYNVRYRELDVRDKAGYEALFSVFRPAAVIHTAGVGSPDFAERNKHQTREINVEGTKNIISLCERYGSQFIYISSNGIYSGENPPYGENDIAKPINFYGQIKLEGEEITKKSKIKFAIVRPILMYGWNHLFERHNIVTIALKKLKNGESVSAYEDVFCNPVSAEFCAMAIWKIIFGGYFDTFNIGGKDRVSIYQLIKTTAEVFGFNFKLVIPIRQGLFGELVKRPKDTTYNTAKMEGILRLNPLPIKQGLEAMKQKIDRNYV